MIFFSDIAFLLEMGRESATNLRPSATSADDRWTSSKCPDDRCKSTFPFFEKSPDIFKNPKHLLQKVATLFEKARGLFQKGSRPLPNAKTPLAKVKNTSCKSIRDIYEARIRLRKRRITRPQNCSATM
jgi:hypothetical protein